MLLETRVFQLPHLHALLWKVRLFKQHRTGCSVLPGVFCHKCGTGPSGVWLFCNCSEKHSCSWTHFSFPLLLLQNKAKNNLFPLKYLMLFLHWNANLLLRSEATVDLHWLLQSQFNSSDNQSLTAQELKMMHLKLKTEFFASPVAAVKVSEISIVLELIWCVTLASQFLFQVSQSK